MARFTKAIRQQIIREFCLKRNAEFDARLFEQDVRETGEAHPAYGWFTWDADKAALEHRVWQAREFASGLEVAFSIEEIGRNKSITVREVQMPMLLSPMDGRRHGGGYFLADPNDAEHMAEFCRQAAADLARWFRRYQAAVVHSGGSSAAIERQIALLEKAAPAAEELEEAA
jgi:hypothetical protein